MNYWYISLSKDYPKKITRQVKLERNFAILECSCLVNKKITNELRLVYIGRGYFKDKHIQDNLISCKQKNFPE